jgi:hypothetical protein
MKAVQHIPGIHRALGYAVGVGVRPEHVRERKPSNQRRALVAGLVCAGVGVGAMVAGVAVCGWATWKMWNKATARRPA